MKHTACTTEKGWAPTQCMECCQVLTNLPNAEDKEAAKASVYKWAKKLSSWMSRVSIYYYPMVLGFLLEIYTLLNFSNNESYHTSTDTFMPTGEPWVRFKKRQVALWPRAEGKVGHAAGECV